MDTRLDTEVSRLMPDGEGHGADVEGGEVRLKVGGDHLQEHALQQLHLEVDGEEEEVEVPEHVAAGVAAAEVPGPPTSSASVVATEYPPALTGKEAAGALGKDDGTSGSRESGDGDLGEEREGGGERPRRRHRRGAPSVRTEAAPQRAVDAVKEVRRDHPRSSLDLTNAVPLSSSSAAGDDDDDPFLLAGFFLAFSALSRERERVSEFVEGKGRR
uniref:Uncharacterized protein n=1 Tax=Oryza glumipatula TaxID=40148 RepID=A0A0E0AS05_9ORYZ